MSDELKAKLCDIEMRHKAAKKLLKGFRRATRHLETTGLTREAALIKAGYIYDLSLDRNDVTVVSIKSGRKAS